MAKRKKPKLTPRQRALVRAKNQLAEARATGFASGLHLSHGDASPSVERVSRKKSRLAAYLDYLNSPAWADRRAAYYARHDRRCQCGSTERIELHHLNYKRLGREEDADLVPLCRDCHARTHGRAMA